MPQVLFNLMLPPPTNPPPIPPGTFFRSGFAGTNYGTIQYSSNPATFAANIAASVAVQQLCLNGAANANIHGFQFNLTWGAAHQGAANLGFSSIAPFIQVCDAHLAALVGPDDWVSYQIYDRPFGSTADLTHARETFPWHTFDGSIPQLGPPPWYGIMPWNDGVDFLALFGRAEVGGYSMAKEKALCDQLIKEYYQNEPRLVFGTPINEDATETWRGAPAAYDTNWPSNLISYLGAAQASRQGMNITFPSNYSDTLGQTGTVHALMLTNSLSQTGPDILPFAAPPGLFTWGQGYHIQYYGGVNYINKLGHMARSEAPYLLAGGDLNEMLPRAIDQYGANIVVVTYFATAGDAGGNANAIWSVVQSIANARGGLCNTVLPTIYGGP